MLFAVPAAWGDEPAARTGPPGKLEGRLLLEAPEGARVWIEREPQGTRRSFSFPGLAPGRHAKYMTVRLPAGGVARATVYVEAGHVTSERVFGPSRIVLCHTGVARLVDPDTGKHHALQDPEVHVCERAVLSPDRSLVAVRRRNLPGGWKQGRAELVLMKASGGMLRTLGHALSGAWSPDGKRIAYPRHVRLRPTVGEPWLGSFDLYVADVATGAETVLTEGTSPRWSPDGSHIAFHRVRISGSDFAGALHMVPADRPTPGTLDDPRLPSRNWSPDGKRILLLRREAGSADVAIHVMNADGSGLRRLAVGWGPRWSPDGSWIAFQRGARLQHAEGKHIHVMRADGTGQRSLARGHGVVWAPDGRKLAFSRVMADQQGSITPADLFVIDRNGQALRRLTRVATSRWMTGPDRRAKVAVLGFAWAPHGDRLAFTQWQGNDFGPWVKGTTALYVVNADGTGLRRLVDPRPAGGGRGDVWTQLHWR